MVTKLCAVFVAAAGLVCSAESLAACTGYSCTGVTIDRLYVHYDGTVYTGTSGTETSLSCTPAAGMYLRLQTTHPGYDQIYALLLTAHENRRTIWLEANNADPSCTISYVVSDK